MQLPGAAPKTVSLGLTDPGVISTLSHDDLTTEESNGNSKGGEENSNEVIA